MKIIELFLDPDALEGGVDLVSLVDKPAHESNFLTFNTDLPDVPTQDLTFIGEMFDIEDQIKLAELVNAVGEPVGTLENDGWVIQSVEPVHSLQDEIEKELKNRKFEYDILSNPNQPSAEDTPNRRVRYKYVVSPGKGAPIIDTSRTFCKDMLRSNRVFRIEDLIGMTEDCTNKEFGCYDILTWRGS